MYKKYKKNKKSKKNKKNKTIIGVMTGTSVDKIDIAAVDFVCNEDEYKFNILHTNSYEIPAEIKKNILSAAKNQTVTSEISELNYKLSVLFAEAINNFLTNIIIDSKRINAVAVHGQTVWHAPCVANINTTPSTLQLVNASALSALINLPVISDFRAADVALGGQGAPLVPIFDYYFLRNVNKNIVALNIGGMANITIIPSGKKLNSVVALDTGCGNVLIDEFMQRLYNKPFDKNGDIARQGAIISDLLHDLLKLEYFKAPPPKSCGREIFNSSYVENSINKLYKNYQKADLIRTLTELTAITISESIKQNLEFISTKENMKNNYINSTEVIVKGGGAKNIFLLEQIQKYLGDSYKISNSLNVLNIDVDYYEAVAFAFLGYLNLLGVFGNVPNVTGAKKQVVLGSRSYNPSL